MTNTNATNFRNHAFEYFNQAIEFNDIINVNTKNGNAIVMSEEDYNNLIETLYLNQFPGTIKDITDGKKAKISDCIPSEEVEW